MSFVLFSLNAGTASLNSPTLNLISSFPDKKSAIDAASKPHSHYLLFEIDTQNDRLIPRELIIGKIP